MNTDMAAAPVVGNAARGQYTVDLTEYLADLSELDVSDAQKLELLEILWSIMAQFVKLGFTTDLCGQLSGGFNQASAITDQVVEFEPSTIKETYKEEYNE